MNGIMPHAVENDSEVSSFWMSGEEKKDKRRKEKQRKEWKNRQGVDDYLYKW